MSLKNAVEKRLNRGLRSYIAFLRGLNMGGPRVIAMTDLRAAFASLGFESPRTILASGNVVFEFSNGNAAYLARDLRTLSWSTVVKIAGS